MKKTDIKRYLKEYSIYENRRTTINHSFACAVSVADIYDEAKLDEALKLLGQSPKKDLRCVYCNKPAETWDHLIALVHAGEFSGFGHQINNLVPCCKKCNSAKGNKSWLDFVELKVADEIARQLLVSRIQAYINFNAKAFEDIRDAEIIEEMAKLGTIKAEVLTLFQKADAQAKVIRDKVKEKSKVASSSSVTEAIV